jgi:hypothetical protein
MTETFDKSGPLTSPTPTTLTSHTKRFPPFQLTAASRDMDIERITTCRGVGELALRAVRILVRIKRFLRLSHLFQETKSTWDGNYGRVFTYFKWRKHETDHGSPQPGTYRLQ